MNKFYVNFRLTLFHVTQFEDNINCVYMFYTIWLLE